ncbi:MAG: DUF4253 domain-containing protein [Candidatus Obscuribacterales bacterium]
MDELKRVLEASGLDSSMFKPALSPEDTSFYSIEVRSENARISWFRAREPLSAYGWRPVLVGTEGMLEVLADTWTCWDAPAPTSREDQSRLEFVEVALRIVSGLEDQVVEQAIMSRTFTDPGSVVEAFEGLNPDVAQNELEKLKRILAEIDSAKLDALMGGVLGSLRIRKESTDFERAFADFECQQRSVLSFIETGERIDPVSWLNRRKDSDEEFYTCETGTWPGKVNPEKESGSNFLGEIARRINPFRKEASDRTVSRDVIDALSGRWELSRTTNDTTLMVCVPAGEPWHVPAHFYYGDWNDCPAPHIHVSLLKHWHEKFGVHVLSMTPDTLELFVENPIMTREDAMRVAEQQFVYDCDLIHQGGETLSALAGTLLGSRLWQFWWD